MVAMFFTVSVVNNYALNLNIAMPLHMIFRSVSSIRPSFSMMSLFIISVSTVPAACILPPGGHQNPVQILSSSSHFHIVDH